MTRCAETSCGIEFEPAKTGQRFCSDRCRARAHRALKKTLNGGQPLLKDSPSTTLSERSSVRKETIGVKPVEKFDLPEGLPPQAAWIIRQQDRNLDQLKEQNQKLIDKLDKVTDERDKARADLAEFKTDTRIKELENAKPSGLGAILPSGIEGILNNEHVGPVIGALLSRVLTPGPTIGAGGEEENSAMGVMMNWLSNQTEEVQQQFGELMSGIIKMEAGKVASSLKQLNNLLKSGSTMTNNKAHVTANGTYSFN